MRIQAYIWVRNDEASIRELHQQTEVPGASIRKLKARRGVNGHDDMWWSWQTAKVNIEINEEDRGVAALLRQYQSYFPAIRKYQGPDANVYLEVVYFYHEEDRPSGFAMTAESIALLYELGGDLDVDAVPDLRIE